MRKFGGPQKRDLTGKRFGRLLVLVYAGRVPTKMDKAHKTFAAWKCQCDCGTIVVKTGRALLHDKTKSCGCLQREAGSRNGRKKLKPETFIKRFYTVYKDSAIRRSIPWALTLSGFSQLVNRPCYLCGTEPEPKALCRSKYYDKEVLLNGIDRIDNNKGYTSENCRPCCTRCNKMKLDLSYTEFILHIKKILKNG